ncbi:MAG TPA: glycosyltransferase [Roseiflexaceae bacterium]|nr:glycosyltransferase [Roseiflexaceae bacterium]
MTEDNRPFVSVVIPTLQEGKYIGRCLDSLANQSYPYYEIIVVDGGSTDDTLAIARSFGVRVILAPGSTVVTARQLGVGRAAGTIIVGADADTFYPADYIAQVVGAFARDPRIVAIGGIAVFEPEPWWCYQIWIATYFVYTTIYRLTGKVVYVAASNFAYTKAAFEQVGGYTAYLEVGGDELDILRKLKQAGTILHDTQLIVYPSSRRARYGFFSYYWRFGIFGYGVGYLLSRKFKRIVIPYTPVR